MKAVENHSLWKLAMKNIHEVPLWILFVLICSLVIFLGLGEIYTTIRLYFIGEYREATVTDVRDRFFVPVQRGPVQEYSPGTPIPYTVLRLKGYDEAFVTPIADYYKKGDTVYLLYSDKLTKGVVTLKKNAGLWHVLTNSHIDQGALLTFSLLVAIAFMLAFSIRLFLFGKNVINILVRQCDLDISRITSVSTKISSVTTAATNILTMVLIILFVFILTALAITAVLHVESSHEIVVGALIFAVLTFLSSPVPERMTTIIYGIIRGTLYRKVVTVIRNFMCCCCLIWAIVRIIQFMHQKDLREFSSLWEILVEIVKSFVPGIR
jgi:hypothetical protein